MVYLGPPTLSLFGYPQILVFVLAALRATCVSSTALESHSGEGDVLHNQDVVDVGYARFVGSTTSVTGQNVTFFGGIPYAKPPLGTGRFAAPQPLDVNGQTGNGTSQPDFLQATPLVDATEWAQPCIQQPAKVGLGVEDCLKLNVWKLTKAKAGDSLPVIVYIHGGGFYAGTPRGFPLHTWVAQSLSQNGRGIVAVSMAYRLNLLGFLGSPSILRGSEGGALNRGLLDQRLALDWVKDNIHKFGGDGHDVTIVGESAGGASVIMQLVAYGGSKPANFKRVVAHSIGYQQMPNMTVVQQRFEVAAAAMGCAVDEFSSDPDLMRCLENVPLESIVAGINSIPNNHLAPHLEALPDGPAEDLKPEPFLPALPSALLHAGRFPRGVQFIGGHTTHDGRNFAGGRPEQFNSEADVRSLVFGRRWPWVTNETITDGLTLYPATGTPGSPFEDEWHRAWTVGGNVVFTCMDLFAAQQITKHNRGTKDFAPAYLFRWNAPNPVLYAVEPWRGVSHTADLFFLFNGTTSIPDAGATFTPFNQTEQYLADEATAYWVSLVTSGNPNHEKLGSSPIWKTAFSSSVFLDPSMDRSTGIVGRRMVLTQNVAAGQGLGRGSQEDLDMPHAYGRDGVSAWRTLSRIEDVGRIENERCAFWMSEEVTRETAV